MTHPSKVRITGPLAPYARGFRAELEQQGYTATSAGFQLQLMAHLSRWLDGRGLEASALGCEVAESFLAERRGAGYTNYLSAKALKPLMGYLLGLGVISPPAPPTPATAAEALLERYRRYLAVERGLAAVTARAYIDMVRPFLAARVNAAGLDLDSLRAGDISAFVLAEAPGRSRGSAKLMVTALRSLLGFLHLEDMIDGSLTHAVPSVAGWRLSGLPRALEPGQVRRLLASCDRRTTVGRRDFAILILLTRLGLRRGEVAGLELGDIDWQAGEVVVRGKGDRKERLPLPGDVGGAVAGYLKRGRRSTAAGRKVFVRVKAPHRPLSPGGVTQVVVAAGKRAGLGRLAPHRLRHTAATEMLRAGAPLAEIGQVLRHRSQLTTSIYAKVDREALRSLARPWPGGVA